MDKYDEIKCIGRGAYGSAHLVTLRETSEKYVVKKIPTELLTEKEKAQSFREVELLAKLKHPNVVEYRENFVEGNVIHIVMAYCDGGDLSEKIRARAAGAYFDVGQILDWFVQMAMAIKYLHQQRILHRDLKTSNIFLTTENVIKLGDFGIAKTLDSTLDQARTVVGTPYYMSPEVCENKPYSYASDVWSLGCVLYEMCALKHAFEAPNIISLIFTIVRKEFAPVPAHYDSEISALLKLLLDKAPEKRPSMDQIFTIPYIRNHMQGLVASGGSLRVNAVARRPFGAPKRRVHAKNMARRSSVESVKRKPRTAATESSSAGVPQWIPITPLDADELWQLDVRTGAGDDDDLELLDASILEESQLDVRAPERSRTPEPLSCFGANDAKPPPAPVAAPSTLARPQQQVSAWSGGSGDDDEDDVVDDDDLHSQLHEEAAELMNPNFETAYSAECMDSLQIYYSSKSAKAKGRRAQHGHFVVALKPTPAAAADADAVASELPLAFRASDLAVDDESLCLDDDDAAAASRHVVMKRFPLHVDESIDYFDDDDALQQWGRRAAAHDDDTVALQLEDASSLDLDANVEMRESTTGGDLAFHVAGDAENEHEHEEDQYESDESDDDYTSLSEYEAEENFYSDDSDFYDEADTQYSDDFDDADAEVIEYANDEFAADDGNDGNDDNVSADASSVGISLVGATATATDASLTGSSSSSSMAVAPTTAGGACPESSLSPTSKKQQRPPTEVQWVMRNVAESLLQSHDDVTVA